MVYRTAQFSMTVTPNHRVGFRVRVMVRFRFRVEKVRKPYTIPKLSNGTTFNDLE